ncbi:MAG: hypothetical protein SGARI_008169 [Bacillariaceae sp.]
MSTALNCPKRQKLNQMTFAATTAKTDLERAGMEFKAFNRDNEEAKAPGSKDVTIKLKGVRLIHSSEVTAPLISSNVMGEYEMLSQAVSDSYASSTKSFEPSPSTQDNGSSDSQSTSSVSDTESDSGSDNNANNNGLGNNQKIFLIPPLVEDSIDPTKAKKVQKLAPMSTCNVISCASNATTMTESLQLSTDPR